ncbi:MAG: hypothetical protein MJA29_08315 [Candidatus Omnitrophica bacterium]|nr:hypothetical protein [Candidatus Omnitrophota bacterium]
MKRKGKHGVLSADTYTNFSLVMSKAFEASREVLNENRRLGIATPFYMNGNIYHLMPDGRIVLKKRCEK